MSKIKISVRCRPKETTMNGHIRKLSFLVLNVHTMYESFSLPQEFKFQVWNFLGKNLQRRLLYCYYFGTRRVEADTVENKRRPLHISWGIEHGSDDNNPVYRPFPLRVIFWGAFSYRIAKCASLNFISNDRTTKRTISLPNVKDIENQRRCVLGS